MAKRIQNSDIARLLAERMSTDEETAATWLEATIETLYETLTAGESVTLTNFGSFYVRPERESWVFRFNPAQRLRAALGWPSTYKPKD
jgi:DNA-binding protein HU-beta